MARGQEFEVIGQFFRLAYTYGWQKVNWSIQVDEYNSGNKFATNQAQIPMTIIYKLSSNNWKSKYTIYQIRYRFR